MTKRVAANQITHDNWNEEDEPEEAGHFEQAATVKLQNREIKKARRRCEKNGVPGSPFGQFAGFVGANKAPFSSFSFQADSPTSNGKNPSLVKSESQNNNNNKTLANFGILAQTKTNSASENLKNARESEKSDSNKPDNKYFEQLKQLNVSFLNWVQEHMNKNQFYDFTPVCMDYVEHMKKLEHPTVAKTLTSEDTHKLNSTSLPSDVTGKNSPAKSSQSSEPRPVVSFSFLTQQKADQKSVPSLAKPFVFSSSVAPKTENKPEADEDDNYVPPKNDFQPVKEQDAMYSKRCKLFYKKGDSYVDKGVGTLYLKEDNGKIQLIIRADTSTGLILLNICLNSSLPISRAGKNSVLLVCIPNPPLDPKSQRLPTPFLLRVKTAEDADDLLENLNKYKAGKSC